MRVTRDNQGGYIILVKMGRAWAEFKTPKTYRLYSERYGLKKPLFNILGYRLFTGVYLGD